MIYLDNTSTKLEVILGGAVATTEPYVTVCYYDVPSIVKMNNSEYRGARKNTRTTGGTAVTVCEAPGDGVTRNIRYICIQQADSAAVTATVRINDGTNSWPQYSQSLTATKSLVYEDGQGWQVL